MLPTHQIFINRKVMLILGVLTCFVLGSSCHQHAWQRSFINRRLPEGSNTLIFSFDFLCLNTNGRSAPKLSDAMPLLGTILSSSSLCFPIPSMPWWYRFNNALLKAQPVVASHFFRSSSSIGENGRAVLSMCE